MKLNVWSGNFPNTKWKSINLPDTQQIHSAPNVFVSENLEWKSSLFYHLLRIFCNKKEEYIDEKIQSEWNENNRLNVTRTIEKNMKSVKFYYYHQTSIKTQYQFSNYFFESKELNNSTKRSLKKLWSGYLMLDTVSKSDGVIQDLKTGTKSIVIIDNRSPFIRNISNKLGPKFTYRSIKPKYTIDLCMLIKLQIKMFCEEAKSCYFVSYSLTCGTTFFYVHFSRKIMLLIIHLSYMSYTKHVNSSLNLNLQNDLLNLLEEMRDKLNSKMNYLKNSCRDVKFSTPLFFDK